MCTYFGKFLWEKSLFEICGWYNDKKNERNVIYTRQGGTMQSPALYLMHFVSVKEQLMWTLKNQVKPPLNQPIPLSKGKWRVPYFYVMA